MRVLRHYEDVPADLQGAVVAVGNFDGVHLGHRAVIGEAAMLAKALGAPLAVLTFEPHPRVLFRPDQPPFRLTPFRAKAIQLTTLDVDLMVAVHFDRAFADKSGEEFIDEVLVNGLAARHVVTGYDFVFGKDRGGDAGLLRRSAAEAGFGFTQVPAMRHKSEDGEAGEIYASSAIREHLQQGRPMEAAQHLGHWWEIDGRVIQGDKRGRQLGFPTANVALEEYLRPAFGVYAVRVAVLGDEHVDAGAGDAALDWREGVANLGRRPTIRDGEQELLEVHFLDFDGDLYGRQLRVALVDHIRPERKFDGLEALTAQISADTKAARAALAAAARPRGVLSAPDDASR